MKSRAGSILILAFIILAAVVLGGLVAELTKDIGFFHWIGYERSVGIPTVSLDLAIIKLNFGFELSINVIQIIFLTAAVFIYRKIR